MSRFLFVVLPLAGHINAPLAVSDALLERGHQVAWCGPQSYLRPLVGPSAVVYPTGVRVYREQNPHGVAALTSLWDRYLVPLARFVLPAVERAVTAWRPDVVVADQHAVAGALVAHRHRLRWASLVTGALELTGPSGGVPEVEALVQARLSGLRELADLPRDDPVDPRFSPYLAIAFTTSALTGAAVLPDNCVLVGPALGRRPADPTFPWKWLDPRRRHVLVTVGTLAEHIAHEFYARAVAALAALVDQLQGIVVAPTGAVPEPPANVLLTARVPMLELMPRLHAVVCHAGMGTVGEALSHGVPLVLAPIRHDQPIVADQVATAGAGVRVPFFGRDPADLRAAVTTVLDEPAYRDIALRVRDSFASAGGATAAAAHLAALAHTGDMLP